MRTMNYTKELPIIDNYDVLVCGGGVAGVTAAAAAAKAGAKTLLVESTGALGGMATNGLLPSWCGLDDGEKIVHRGLAGKILESLYDVKMKNWSVDELPGTIIDVEKLKRIFDNMLAETNTDILFHTQLVDAMTDGKNVTCAVIANKGKLSGIKAKVYIDCSGDADLAAFCDAEYAKGDSDGDMMPVTLCFTISNVNLDCEFFHPDTKAWTIGVIVSEEFPLIKDLFINGYKVGPNTYSFNSGHLWDIDNTDPVELSNTMVQAREMVYQYEKGLKKILPDAFKNSFLVNTAALLGVRENRRIIGDYILTRSDYNDRKHFADEVTVSTFYIDIHPSLKKLQLIKEGKWDWEREKNESMYRPGESLGIPYRCLTPKALNNVLIAGRSISCEREVFSATRAMPCCMSLGEAAGTAAAIALTQPDCNVHLLDTELLRKQLKYNGVYLP